MIKKTKNIFITGGAGYVGAELVPKLLNQNYNVTVLDLMIYGDDNLPNHDNLKIIRGDIRDRHLLDQNLPNHDTVIHLACISNDPSFELNPSLGKSINFDAFEPLIKSSVNSKISKFIYASSSSVYGIKKEKNVTEDMILDPLTDYSIFKAQCEKILFKYTSSEFITTIIRPATVCGYSKRQRLDVVVNILTNLAYHKRKISIFGGSQLRPNIHISDMADSYLTVLNSNTDEINNQIFNVGFENQTVSSIAQIVKDCIGEDVELIKSPTDDNRSYHISSEKIKRILNFVPKKNILDAVKDLKNAFEENKLHNPLSNENYFNLKKMQNIKLV